MTECTHGSGEAVGWLGEGISVASMPRTLHAVLSALLLFTKDVAKTLSQGISLCPGRQSHSPVAMSVITVMIPFR